MAVPVGGVEWRYEVDVVGVEAVVSSKAGADAAATSMDRNNMGDLVTSPNPINGDPNAAGDPPPVNNDGAGEEPSTAAAAAGGGGGCDAACDAETVVVAAAGSLGMGDPGTSNDDRASRNHFAAGD